MPKRLLDRCQPDSICEFRAAARQRSRDALALVASERRTAAIYLWGYAAEMTLKAAYYNAIGFTESQHITVADLHAAKATAPSMGVTWSGNLHDIGAWAELLVATRATVPGIAYSVPHFGSEVVSRARRIQLLWSEILRYHKNVAYVHEVEDVQASAQWLLSHSFFL